MKIGIAGPISLKLISALVDDGDSMNNGYAFPMTAHIVRELVERGHDVCVFTLDPLIGERRQFHGDRLTIRAAPMRARARARAKDLFKSERQELTQAIIEEQCDVLHAHWTYEFALACLATKTPTLVSVHDWAPNIFKLYRDRYRFARLLMSTTALVRSKHLTATSPYIAAKLKRWKPKTTVPVIPNAVANESFTPVDRVRKDSLVVGAINNGFSRIKNVKALLEAFSIVRLKFPHATMMLAGSDYEPKGPAYTWSLESSLSNGVTFIGPIDPDRLPEFWQEIDVFVHPSLEESFGLVLAEAMAAGVPVIGGGSSGAVPWVLDNGRAGLLVDVRSPRQISQAVIELHEDQSKWISLSKRGKEHVAANFTVAKVTAAYEREYQRLV